MILVTEIMLGYLEAKRKWQSAVEGDKEEADAYLEYYNWLQLITEDEMHYLHIMGLL